jgi:hypothetical protein
MLSALFLLVVALSPVCLCYVVYNLWKDVRSGRHGLMIFGACATVGSIGFFAYTVIFVINVWTDGL